MRGQFTLSDVSWCIQVPSTFSPRLRRVLPCREPSTGGNKLLRGIVCEIREYTSIFIPNLRYTSFSSMYIDVLRWTVIPVASQELQTTSFSAGTTRFPSGTLVATTARWSTAAVATSSTATALLRCNEWPDLPGCTGARHRACEPWRATKG
jgi:hypothetical protein